MDLEQNYEFPQIYNMTPFFTLQPVLNTRTKQIEMWTNLILDYIRYHHIHQLSVREVSTSPLFFNSVINRRLTVNNIVLMIDHLVEKGNAEWIGKDKDRVIIYWRTPAEWANLIYQYVNDTGLTDQVCTIYELREGDDVQDQEFFQLDLDVFMKALDVLEKFGKAKVFGSPGDTNLGVKFFLR